MGTTERSVPESSGQGGRRGRRPYGRVLVHPVPTTGRHLALIAAAVAQFWVFTAGPVLSAPATPASLPTCDRPARSLEGLAALLAASAVATPAATTGGQTLPEGTPADAERGVAMERLVRLWLACQNAGEPLRAWSLYSDGYLYRLLSRQGGLSGEAYQALATPAPIAAEAARVLAIEGERLLPDGRYGATVTLEYPSVPMPKRFFFFFTEVDDRLLIDGILGEISFSLP
jgi:hypothetical protein